MEEAINNLSLLKNHLSKVVSLGILLGFMLTLGGCWNGISPLGVSEVEEVTEADVVGVRADQNFENSGKLSLLIIPRNNGKIIKPESIRSLSVVSDESSYEAYPIDRQKKSPDSETDIAGVILLDSTGSMSSNDPSRERVDASKLFIDRLTNSNIPTTLGVFDFGGDRQTPECFDFTRILQDYTQNANELKEGVEQTIALGNTPLFHSAEEVTENLGLTFRGDNYKRIVLLLSDGENNQGGTVQQVVQETKIQDVKIIAVSLGRSAGEEALSRMASQSDGSTVNVENAEELLNIFDGLATTLTQDYLEASVRLDPVPQSGTTLTLRIIINREHNPIITQAKFTAP